MAKKLQIVGKFPSSGSGSGSSPAIVDTIALPETGIEDGVLYRVPNAVFIYNKEILDSNGFQIFCVNGLPEAGEPVTNADMSELKLYYNIADNTVSGYATAELGAAFGIPAGWYPAETVFQLAGSEYGGVITDIADDPADGKIRVLVGYEYYAHKLDWNSLKPDWNENNPFSPAYIKNRICYESDPLYDITWDGDTTDKVMVPLDSFDKAGWYLVKVSDRIISLEELWGATAYTNEWIEVELTSDNTNSSIPGVVGENDMGVASVYDSALITEAMGGLMTIPTGTYFLCNPEQNLRVVRLAGPTTGVQSIDTKYFRDSLSEVAFSGSYNDLNGTPTVYTDVVRYANGQGLSSTQKSYARNNIDVYSKSEVDNKIANIDVDADLSNYYSKSEIDALITGAIGGSY